MHPKKVKLPNFTKLAMQVHGLNHICKCKFTVAVSLKKTQICKTALVSLFYVLYALKFSSVTYSIVIIIIMYI